MPQLRPIESKNKYIYFLKRWIDMGIMKWNQTVTPGRALGLSYPPSQQEDGLRSYQWEDVLPSRGCFGNPWGYFLIVMLYCGVGWGWVGFRGFECSGAKDVITWIVTCNKQDSAAQDKIVPHPTCPLKISLRTPLVVQWVRIHLPMQGPGV